MGFSSSLRRTGGERKGAANAKENNNAYLCAAASQRSLRENFPFCNYQYLYAGLQNDQIAMIQGTQPIFMVGTVLKNCV